MKSIVAYVRSLLGWSEDEPTLKASFKRERTEDDFSSDEDLPALKKLKHLKKTSFPDIQDANDLWTGKEKQYQKIRYVPIQLERGQPSTSTPLDTVEKCSRVRTVPIKFVNISKNGESTPSRKPRMHTPVRPVIHAVIEDEDDDDDEVTYVETVEEPSQKCSKMYIEEKEANGLVDEDDVIFVKTVKSPTRKPFKFFVSKNNQEEKNSRDDTEQYYRLSRKENNRNNFSPKANSKFIMPAGITKAYKKPSAPVAKWMQISNTSNSLNPRSKLNNYNGKSRTALTEVFNLDEKRNYQELIKRVAGASKTYGAIRNPTEIINLADDSASFRNTQRAQKKALNEITLVEKGLRAQNEIETNKEYDPITVASINSSDSEVEVVPSESSASSSVRIDPLNSLRDSFKDKPVTGNDWLAKIDSKYKKKNQDTQEKLRDARRVSDIISKINFEQSLAQLEKKIKNELSLPDSFIEEPQPTVELPKLSAEQEMLVNKVLGPGPSGQLLVEKFNLRIHRRDIQTLAGLNWLNDEVINFYMNLLMQRSTERKDLPKVYATNTFFYPKLIQSGQLGLKRWTRKIDIFAHDLIVVPVHLGVHWCLSLIDFREKKINYLDSMGGRNQTCLNALLQYLKDEHKDKKGQPFDDSGWKTECLKDIPQQMNGSDCGMFACTFAEFACRNAPYTFSQQHMPYLRRKAALEIVTGKLLL